MVGSFASGAWRTFWCALVALTLIAPVALQAQDPAPQWQKDATPAAWDWIQLTTHEWLKGQFLGMYDEELEFDSDKMNLQTFKWKDIDEVHTAHVMEVGLASGAVAVGKLVVAEGKVLVVGDGTVELDRSQILTIAPWARSRRFRSWLGRISAGTTVLRGNTNQIDSNVNALLKRQTAGDRVALNYMANISRTDEQDLADNQRFNGNWDHFITRRFFVKPVSLEWYSDTFQNINSRSTLASGAGFRIIKNKRTEWEVSAGVGYQLSRFASVEAGEAESKDTAAFSGGMYFEEIWSKSLEFTYQYTFHLVNDASGRYTHHMLAMIETKWTRLLDFDVSLVWDRTQLPQPGADGVVPKQDDFRTVIALGIEF